MRVIYKSIFDEIMKARKRAVMMNRTIDKIFVTSEEYEELLIDAKEKGLPTTMSEIKQVYGIGIEVENNEQKK